MLARDRSFADTEAAKDFIQHGLCDFIASDFSQALDGDA
jgi:hypothetical protein